MSKEKKDLITLVIGKVLQVIIALVSIRILTEVLDEKEVGNYYLLLGILTFFNFTFLNPLGQYYGRHVISWEASKNLLNATNVLIVLRICAIFISLLFAYGIFEYFGYSKYYTLLEFISFIFIALVAGTYLVLLSVVNTLGDRIKFIKYLVTTLLFGLFFSLFTVFFIDKSAMAWLYGIAISQLIFMMTIYSYLRKGNKFSWTKVRSVINKEYIKKVSYFIFPITVTLFLQWGQNISYRFIIEAKYSIEVLALIAVGFSVSGAIFSAVEGLVIQYFNPIYLRQITNASKIERTKAWNGLASYIIPVYVFLTLFVIILAPYLVHILVAEKFHDAYVYVMFGAMIEFFRASANIIYLVSQSELKTNTTISPYAAGFLISIGTLYLVDFTHTLWAIPLVLIGAYVLIFFMLFISMKKLLPIEIDFSSIGKAFLIALPFGLIYFLEVPDSIIVSVFIVVIAGIYFLFGLYVLKPNKEGKML